MSSTALITIGYCGLTVLYMITRYEIAMLKRKCAVYEEWINFQIWIKNAENAPQESTTAGPIVQSEND